MKTVFNLPRLLGVLFLCFSISGFAQNTEKKKSAGDAVYQEYQQNGIDSALKKYGELKSKSGEYTLTEWELNRIGYQIMMDDEDLEAAEKIFSLNMKEYPQAANPRDSYADYLIEKGDTEGAKKYLKESIAIAEKSDKEDEQTRIFMGSKAKLAKLENKHKQLDFLVGNWNLNSTMFTNGVESGKETGTDEVVYEEASSLITINHKNSNGDIIGKRMMVYDPIDEAYDVVYINTMAPMGIENSRIKIKEAGDNKLELVETYTDRKGEKKKMRHEINKKENNKLDWVIFESGANEQEWKKVYAMNMEKRN
ncbi:DUF1579 domain-containing protein [Antarcticibacterium arcticum]|uniref:DUF1579 domain-containing protein n=1 Tax=Antarcticibacterium arcticum TaxID=2585771 RepID=A0A5B8YLN8_9FLAO|nr:DUF1579 domain-containing protein [Antarcticibacterium arcticum]QED37553.1 DUF1579 domain-containing protein [Antarcticibacterium arcticum]